MTRRRRLAIYMYNFAVTGIVRGRLVIAEEFIKRGYQVDIVVVNGGGSLRAEVPQGVRVIDLECRSIVTSLPALMNYLRKTQPAALLSSSTHTNCVAILARRWASSSARLVISEHARSSRPTKGLMLTARKLLGRLIARVTYPFADKVLAVSNGLADDISTMFHFPRKQIDVVYDPVVTPHMLRLSHEHLDHLWFRGTEIPVLLSAGRLHMQKDFPTLLRAFALLRKRRRIRLVILGEGNERKALERLIRDLNISDDVLLLGFVQNPYAYMRAASLFVLSSRSEGLCNVLIEAMACGTPVVSTNCLTGPEEILEGGEWGPLTPVGDVEALSRAMDSMLALGEHDGDVYVRRAMDFSGDIAAQKYERALFI